MTKKTGKAIFRIVAVLMVFTLLPFQFCADMVLAEAKETSIDIEEVYENDEAFSENYEDETTSAEDASANTEEMTVTQSESAEDALTEDRDEGQNKESSALTSDVDVTEEVKEAEEEKTPVDIDNKEQVLYVHNFTTDGFDSDDFFTISGKKQGSPKSFEYTDKMGNVLPLNAALKMETATSISFTANSSGTLILVHPTDFAKTTKVNGEKKTAVNGIIEVDIQKGKCKVEKGDTTDLYYIAFLTEAADPKEQVATPTADLLSGEVQVGSIITLSCDTEGATIYYSVNGSDPKTNDKNSIIIDLNMVNTDNKVTIKAYATKEGYDDSDTATFTCTVSMEPGENQLERPTAEPDSDEVPRGTKVILKSADTNAFIYYTLDGTVPSKDNGTLFKESAPIVIEEETTIKAIATANGKDDSFPATFTYTIKQPKISIDENSASIISSVELEGDVSFVNQNDEEVFDIQLKAETIASPSNDVKAKAEELKEDGGEILYYDFILTNAKTDTVSFAKNTQGKLKIRMPYSLVPKMSKRNEITVLHNTSVVEITKEADGFLFYADSFSPYTVIVNPVPAIQDIAITESAGYEEGAYAEWEAVDGADGYMAYVAPAGGEFARIDDELIRKYDDYWRVDTVGLKKGIYYIKVNAVMLDKKDSETTATVIATKITKSLKVTNHDRSGYAWVNGTSSGAYNEDGSLKSNANVIYVTDETKDTVSLDVTGATSNPCVGIQTILNGYKKGKETKPLVIRIIGNVTIAKDLDKDDIVVDSNAAGITVEGIGEDAVANGWGIRFKHASNVELRNLAFMNRSSVGEKDNVGLQQDNDHIWVHNCDLFYGNAGKDADQIKGDGAMDCKDSNYVTFSYNHFWDSGKCCLLGLAENTNNLYITYHHNWFDHSDSRHPRVRFFTTHVYNNYYDGNAKYGIGGAKGGASIFAENNYFRNCKYPMLISMQGSDLWDEGKQQNVPANGTFSSEDGSIIKAYGNIMEGQKRFIPYSITDNPDTTWNESVDFDAYVAVSRNEKVPDKVKSSQGGFTYNNFDTESDFYDYTPDEAKDVPAIVMQKAGRLNGGDFKWDFDNAVEDSNFIVIDELKTAILNYQSSVNTIGGGVEGKVIVLEDDSSSAPDGDLQTVSAPKANKAAGEVEVGTKIELTSETSGAKIYYTINSSAPTSTSTPYEGPIIIEKDTIIRAIAILGNSTSDVSIFKYTVPGGTGGDNSGGDNSGGDNSGGNNQPENTTIVKYEFNPELIGFNLTDTETDSSGTVKQIYKMPTDDTIYGDYFTIGNNSAGSGKIAKTSTSGKTLAAPKPSKSDVTGYNVRYQFGGTADDPRAIRFTTKNKARVSVAAYRVNDNVRDLYLDTDDNVKALTRTATEYTFDIVEAGSHSVYAKDGDIAVLYVIVEEFVPITDDNVEVKEPYSMLNQGEVPKGTSVELKCDTIGAKIYFTTDGTDPTPRDELLYKVPIVVNEAVTIKAISAKGKNISSVVSFVYTVSTGTSGGDTQNIETPKATPGDGAQFPSTGGLVELACNTEGAIIYYTTSSNENDLTDPADNENIGRREYNNTPIPIKEETYIWAVAVKDGVVSNALKCHYTVLAEGAVVQPIATPDSSEVASGTKVELYTTDPVDNIYYTIGITPAAAADPTLENSGRIVYDTEIQIVITEAVTIKAVAQKGGKYSDVATFTYTIVSEGTETPDDPALDVKTIKLEDCEITVPAIIRNTSKKADAKQPSVTYVTYKYTDGSGEEKHVKFAEGEYLDYKVVWNGAVEGKENTYSVTLTGLGREEDQFKIDTASTITKEYKVIDKPGKNSTVKVIDISKAKVCLAAADIKNVVYTGYAIEPKLDYSKDKDNLLGKLNIAYKNNINAGKATVIISAKPELNDENTIYIGFKTLTFNIKKAALNKDNAKATAKVGWDESFSMTSGHDYTGTPVIVKGLKVESSKGRILRRDMDYTVIYKNNARAGKATVTVKGIGNNLSGSWTQNFTINPVDLKTLTYNIKELPYSPNGAKLASITAKNAANDVYTLQEGIDYTAKYIYTSKTKEAGSKVIVSISGKGACTGRDIGIGELDIVKADFAECTFVPEDIAVDGKNLTRELAKAIVVTDASGMKLVVNKDYTIGTPNKEARIVTISPVDTKNYENTCIVPYRIATNLAKDRGFIFDKNKEKIAPLAFDGRNPVMLTAGIINEYVGPAYQLGKNIEIVPGTYKNNTQKGTAQVTVRGKAGVNGGFYGQKVLKFKIVEK